MPTSPTFLATRCSRPSFREVLAWRKPRFSASRSLLMIPARGARRAISSWPKRSWTMNKMDNPRKALGKGLGSLLPTRQQAVAAPPAPDSSAQTVPIDSIDPNPLQPRRAFQPERLADLAQSIRSNGIIQPLVVRRVGDRYQLVAGERRWRAAKLAELHQVPVVVRDIPDDRLLDRKSTRLN